MADVQTQQLQQAINNLTQDVQKLSLLMLKISSQSSAFGDIASKSAQTLQRYNASVSDLSNGLKNIKDDLYGHGKQIERERELYKRHIDKQSALFGQDLLQQRDRLREGAKQTKEMQLQSKTAKREADAANNAAKQKRAHLKAEYDKQVALGNLTKAAKEEQEQQLRDLAKVINDTAHASSAAVKTMKNSTDQLKRIENDLAHIEPKVENAEILQSWGKRIYDMFAPLRAWLDGLMARSVNDTINTAKGEISHQGYMGGLTGNGPSQSSTALLGLSRPEFVEMAAQHRRAMLAMGGMTETVDLLTKSQSALFDVTGSLKDSTMVAMQQMTLLTNHGIKLTAEGFGKYTDEMARDYKRYGAISGQTMDQYSSAIASLVEDESTQVSLRNAASEAERLQIIRNTKRRYDENLAMGMTVEQATAAAKAMAKLAGEGPMERYKKSVKFQAALGAMGIGGGAEAARIMRKSESRRTAAENAFLQSRISSFSNKTSSMMDIGNDSDLGSGLYAERIRQVSGISEGELSQLNTKSLTAVAPAIDKNSSMLEKLNQQMGTWLEAFKAQQIVKSRVENTPWLAMLTGVVASGVLLQIVKFVSNLAGTVIDPKKWLGKLGTFGKRVLGRGGAAGIADDIATTTAAEANTKGSKGSGLLGGLAEGLEKLSNPRLLIGVGVLAALAIPMFTASKALQSFADVTWDEVGKGTATLLGLSAVSTVLAVSSKMFAASAADMAIGVVGLTALSGVLYLTGNALQTFSGVDWKTVGVGLATVAGMGVIGGIAGLAAPAIGLGAAALGGMAVALLGFSTAAMASAKAFDMFAGVNWQALSTGLGLFGTGLSQLWDNMPNPVTVAILGTSMAGLGVALMPLAGSISLLDTDKLGVLTTKLEALASLDADKLMDVAKATQAVSDATSPTMGSMVTKAVGGMWDMVTNVFSDKPSNTANLANTLATENTNNNSNATDTKHTENISINIERQLDKMTEANKYLKVVADNVPTLVELANKQLAVMTLTDKEKESNRNKIRSGSSSFSAATYQYI